MNVAAPTRFNARIARLDDHDVVQVAGDLDWANAEQFSDCVASALAMPLTTPLILDLTGVTFFDSNGIGALVRALGQANERGRSLTLVTGEDRIRHLLQMTGLDTVFAFHDSVATAVRDRV